MKSIGFFICSNGYGHYKRAIEIASLLYNNFNITIYSNYYQFDKFEKQTKSTYCQLFESNIRWDKTLKRGKVDYKQYKAGIRERVDLLSHHDYVISDNIVGILKYRPDAIICGSFLWKDVLFNKFGPNKISDLDSELIEKHNPILITNKYAETGTIKKYSNKVQFGFGCEDSIYREQRIEQVITLESSLNYLQKQPKTSV